MENISYIGLSQQLALREQMEVAANNIANINTPGFKAEGVMFNEYLNEPKDGKPKDAVRQVIDYGTYRDVNAGPLQQTHNPLDLAIQSEGYFSVKTDSGLTRYTRDGSFALNQKRELVTKAGHRLMGEGGAIVIPAEASKISVTGDGTVTTELGVAGKIRIVNFDNQQLMVKLGDNLYQASQKGEKPVSDPRVVQGMIEGSNVNPIVEMNKMIELLRLFQATQRMLQNDHERIRGTIQKLTRV